jgi:hypothetical protein
MTYEVWGTYNFGSDWTIQVMAVGYPTFNSAAEIEEINW